MKESGNYPQGAEYNPNAPWNQSDPEPIEVEVTISQSLSRSTKIKVTDYVVNEWEDVESDDEGSFYRTGEVEYDFSDSDLKGAYEEQECDIPQLLELLKTYLIRDIQCEKNNSRKKRLQHILECCEGWEVDETEVVEN